MPCYSRLLSWVVLSSSISACIETGPPEEFAEQKAQALIPAGAVSEFAPRTPALTFDIPKSERLNPGNNLTLLVQNQRDVAADVTFHVTVGSERGQQRRDKAAALALGARGSDEIALPMAALGLPPGLEHFPGHIIVTATASYADGKVAHEPVPAIFFSPEGNGWDLFDDAERKRRPGRGGRSAQARAAADRFGPRHTVVPVLVRNEAEAEADRAGDGADSQERDTEAPASGLSQAELVSKLRAYAGLPAVKPFVPNPADDHGQQSQTHTATTRYCIRQQMQHTDSGGGEDFYTQATPQNRLAIGNMWEIHGPVVCNGSGCNFGSTLATGVLGDGITGSLSQGCTETITLPSNQQYMFTIWTLGAIGGSNIAVTDEWVGNVIASIGGFFNLTSSPPSTTNLTMLPAAFNVAQNAYSAVAYALTQGPGLTPLPLIFLVQVNDTGTTCGPMNTPCEATFADHTASWIGRSFAQSKFTITHEFGHSLQLNNIGETPGSVAYNLTDTGSGACTSANNGHTLRGREFISAAHLEGFASFYAAHSFNSRLGDDCFIFIAGEWVDCEGTGLLPNAWMDNNCPAPLGGRGNETDWQKQFWDVRTNGSTLTAPSLNAMIQWIEDANDTTAYTTNNHYTLLHAAANAAGRPAALTTNWNASDNTNGIIH